MRLAIHLLEAWGRYGRPAPHDFLRDEILVTSEFFCVERLYNQLPIFNKADCAFVELVVKRKLFLKVECFL